MQFSFITLFAVVAGLAVAAPVQFQPSVVPRGSCDVARCAIALGPAAVGCGAAVVEGGANPIADISCLAAGLNTVVNTPAACTACADELGITSAVNGVIDGAENAVSGAAGAIGSLFSDN